MARDFSGCSNANLARRAPPSDACRIRTAKERWVAANLLHGQKACGPADHGDSRTSEHAGVGYLSRRSRPRADRQRPGRGNRRHHRRHRDRRPHRQAHQGRVGLRRRPVDQSRNGDRRPIQPERTAWPADDHRSGHRLRAADHQRRGGGRAAGDDDPAVGRRRRVHREGHGVRITPP